MTAASNVAVIRFANFATTTTSRIPAYESPPKLNAIHSQAAVSGPSPDQAKTASQHFYRLEHLTKPDRDARCAIVIAQVVAHLARKYPSDTAFSVLPAIICLDTSRFGHRLMPLSRTRLPFPSQWFD